MKQSQAFKLIKKI